MNKYISIEFPIQYWPDRKEFLTVLRTNGLFIKFRIVKVKRCENEIMQIRIYGSVLNEYVLNAIFHLGQWFQVTYQKMTNQLRIENTKN